MPDLIREAIIDGCCESKASDALVGSCALAAISLACQNFADVERLPGLVGPTSLFVTTLAISGERKTGAESPFVKPFRDYDEEQERLKEQKSAKHLAALDAWKIEVRRIRSELAKAAKKGLPTKPWERKLEEL